MVLLLEAAVGGLALLWVAPLWGVVRPGFFKLAGAVITVCAACAWAAGRSALDGAGGRAELAVQALGVFALAAVAWQVLLYARQPAAARWVGIAALVPGFAATILLA